MLARTEGKSFWTRLIGFLAEVVEITETLVETGNNRAKKAHALELVSRWYRSSGIRIPYIPGPVERWVVRRIASRLIDGLVEVLKNHAPAHRA